MGLIKKETSPEKEKPNKEDKGTQTENSKVENVVHKSQYGIMPLVHSAKNPIIKKMENTTGKDNGTGGSPGGGTGADNGTGGNPGGGTGTDNGTGGNPGGGTGTDNGTGGNPGGGTGTDNGTGGNPGGGTGTDNGTGGNPGGGTGTDNGTGGNPGGGTGTDNGTGGNPGGETGTDNGTGGNPGGGTGTDNGTGGNPGGGTGTDNGTGGNPGGETGTDNGKVIESTTNQVVHQKAEVLTKNISSVLIKEAVDTVESYQGLMSLYEMYYGIDLRTKDVGPKLEEGSLDAIATDQSLYYVLNKQSLIDLISNLVSSSITTEVKQDMTGLKQKNRLLSTIHY